MQEIRPGVWHWSTFHEGIGDVVHSYYVEATEPAFVIDPREPDEGFEWFDGHAPPAHAYLTNRHHYRHADRFEALFSLDVRCHRAGLHEFVRSHRVLPFEHGDLLPGGVLALEVGALCPEETALFLPAAGGLVALGDSVIRDDGALAFVPDGLMGDDPRQVKVGLRRALRHLLERRFDTLLLAHGEPVVGGAHRALERFLGRGHGARPRPHA